MRALIIALPYIWWFVGGVMAFETARFVYVVYHEIEKLPLRETTGVEV